ncbi:hypothetical protein [Pannonibacter phragmitetus]|uniref:hypothetical protein n=1 Tax=Pannonibacter phragmitetus TaxID=121719 RepID=UPI000F45B78D|nr:hypothetical protein [Pannonibacter phragmitetus]
MHIDKSYFTLPEILERWQITEADLIYLAENDKLRLSVRVFGVPIEFGDYEEAADGESYRVPWEQSHYSGLLDLHARDVFQLFRCGEVHLDSFRTPKADYATTWGDAQPVLVMIGDLLLRRDERDRFEIETGFSPGGQPIEEATFIHSADYFEVRCNGCRFKLGPIQAEVVRALHEAAQAGEPWQNGKAILSRAGSKSLRMADVFKSQKDWRHLIRSDRRGGYRLNLD